MAKKRYYDRYKFYRDNGSVRTTYGLKIKKRATDVSYIYRTGIDRLDKLSQDYYGTPFYNWLILQANPQHGATEFDIPDDTVIRIPYPLEEVLDEIEEKVQNLTALDV